VPTDPSFRSAKTGSSVVPSRSSLTLRNSLYMKNGIQTRLFCAVILSPFVVSSCGSNNTNSKLIDPPSSSQHVFKQFKEPSNTAVFTTKFVVDDKRPITLVRHNPDDSTWEFFSDDKYNDFKDVAKIIGLGQLIKIDSSVQQIADMKLGYYAHRKTKQDNWTVEKLKEK